MLVMKARLIVDQSRLQHVFKVLIFAIYFCWFWPQRTIFILWVLGSKKIKNIDPTDESVIGLWSKLVNCPNKTVNSHIDSIYVPRSLNRFKNNYRNDPASYWKHALKFVLLFYIMLFWSKWFLSHLKMQINNFDIVYL